MSTSMKAVRRFVARRYARSIIAVLAAIFAATIATPSQAQGVQYTKICTLYGAGFFYIPGTDTCTSAYQIQTNQFDISRASTFAATGTAMAASLVAPWLPTGTNYAVSNHWAIYDGQNALGMSGLMRIRGNLVFSAGFAAGLDRGSLSTFSDRTQTAYGTSAPAESWSNVRGLGRAGFMYAW